MLHTRYQSMLHISFVILACQYVLSVFAQDPSVTDTSAQPISTACGDIIDFAEGDITNNFFYASDAYACLTSVPLNIDVALRFIEYYNTTLQFQSTLAYLKDPPGGYQQPSVDVLQGLEDIRQNLENGFYKNQYDFEAALQMLVYSIHDAHVVLETGILSAFTFGSQYDIMSVSVDGKQLPQPYIAQDVVDSLTEGWTPSPIVKINGEDATTYLTLFAAANSLGRLDPHADWNQLMYTPVEDILGIGNTFGWDAPLYPGDNLTFGFANGTTLDTQWLAIYQNYYRTGPLTTGGDFYNYFVLGFLPASFTGPELRVDSSANDTDTNSTDIGSAAPNISSWNSISPAYPDNPEIVQTDLSLTGGGFVTGYFLNSTSTGVLSIPSFQEFGAAVGSFSGTVNDFITRAQEVGLEKVVIDLQGNSGGTPLLAFDLFAQFFPNIEPFAGSRRRSHRLGNILGAATTNFWSSLRPDNDEWEYDIYHDAYAADEWVIADRINAATNHTFANWQEYQGPIPIHGDTFTLVERYNISDSVFDTAAFDGWRPAGYDGSLRQDLPPWTADNVIILTDGACSSSCALFVEMMTQQANVRTVVVGGAPSTGPMQAVSGSRGAIAYSSDILDGDFQFAGSVNETANTTLPQEVNSGMAVYFAGFNLRDQIRKGDTTPLQFIYEAADCRIYYTMANAYNETRLWLDAAAAIWTDPSLCVAGSTGYTTSANSTNAAKPPPPRTAAAHTNMTVHISLSSTAVNTAEDNIFDGLNDGLSTTSSLNFKPCDGTCKCAYSAKCPDMETVVKLCSTSCNSRSQTCGGGYGTCAASNQFESKLQSGSGKGLQIQKKFTQTICQPTNGSPFQGCPGVKT